jgi:ribosome-associated protein
MPEEYLVVELNHQPIELCKLLKIANLVSGGGEAKIVISEGYVLLNGEVEFQKRKKVYHEDIIEFNGDILQVIIVDDMPENTADNSNLKSVTDRVIDNDVTDGVATYSNESYEENTTITENVNNTSAKKKKKPKQENKRAGNNNKKTSGLLPDEIEAVLAPNSTTSSPRKRKPISF